ncbi:hypothetical protein AB0C34_17445 [Nocardia sp. NPDC049220]|uniref:hypothetical protein n=1 Tax=Nocardia sp. NPDC049220 TaxID=3155273 RepID=UPI003407C6B8
MTTRYVSSDQGQDDEMDNNTDIFTTALLVANRDMPAAIARSWASDLGGWLDEQGYALVKLPEMVVDQDGFETWPVEQEFDEGTVRVRQTDDRIDFTSVSTPFESSQAAVSFAAALIAAARHNQSVE